MIKGFSARSAGLLLCALAATQVQAKSDEFDELMGVINTQAAAPVSTNCQSSTLEQEVSLFENAVRYKGTLGCKALGEKAKASLQMLARVENCNQPGLLARAQTASGTLNSLDSDLCANAQGGFAGVLSTGLGVVADREEKKRLQREAAIKAAQEQAVRDQARRDQLLRDQAIALQKQPPQSKQTTGVPPGSTPSRGTGPDYDEVCPFGEPYQSQCQARNAARKAARQNPASGGASTQVQASAPPQGQAPTVGVAPPSTTGAGRGFGYGGTAAGNNAGSRGNNSGGSSTSMTYTDCLHPVLDWGSNCGKPRSLAITVRNTCSIPLEADMCMEREGKASCGHNFSLDPGKTMYSFVCESNGQYKLLACEKNGRIGDCSIQDHGSPWVWP